MTSTMTEANGQTDELSMSTTMSRTSLVWLDLLEKEFDGAFVNADTCVPSIDSQFMLTVICYFLLVISSLFQVNCTCANDDIRWS